MEFRRWIDLLGLPIYVYSLDCPKIYCDKIYVSDGMERRQRYVIQRERCTCMSYIKGNMCKHLRMMHGQFEFLGGVGKYFVVEDVNELIERMGAVRPMLLDELPSVVHCVTLEIDLPEDVFMVVSVRKINQEHYAMAFGTSL